MAVLRATHIGSVSLAIFVLTSCGDVDVSGEDSASCIARIEFEGRTYVEETADSDVSKADIDQRSLVGRGNAVGCEDESTAGPDDFEVYSVGDLPVEEVIYVEPAYGLMRVSDKATVDTS
jgi:hypothetical protein